MEGQYASNRKRVPMGTCYLQKLRSIKQIRPCRRGMRTFVRAKYRQPKCFHRLLLDIQRNTHRPLFFCGIEFIFLAAPVSPINLCIR